MKKIIVSLLILIASASSLFWLNRAGISARKSGRPYALAQQRFPAYLVRRTPDSYLLWKQKGAHGRIVVHLGKYLHFMPSEPPASTLIPEVVREHSRLNEGGISYRDFLRGALQGNLAREIITVIPPEEFRKRFGLAAAAPVKEVTDHEYGSPRIFTTRLPATGEPVLLNIDASYFASVEPATLLDSLLHSGLRADLVTLCLAEDNPDVTAPERQRLQEFARLLGARAEVIPFTPSSGSATVTK